MGSLGVTLYRDGSVRRIRKPDSKHPMKSDLDGSVRLDRIEQGKCQKTEQEAADMGFPGDRGIRDAE